MKVQLDMYQTLAIAVLVLLLGSYLRKKIKFLERFCIPAPVVGGLLFAIFTCICYVTHILEFSFDDTLKEVCMVFFFTSVGFQANLKVLKKGGKSMVIFLGLVIVLIFIQNGVAAVHIVVAPLTLKSSSTGPNAPAVPCPPTIGIEPVHIPISESSPITLDKPTATPFCINIST